MGKPRVLLIFPPQWTPLNPHFAMATLGGHLRDQGYPVKLLDLNVGYYRRVLSRRFLELSLARARNTRDYLIPKTLLNLRRGARTPQAQRENVRLVHLEECLARDHRQTLERIDEAVSVFDSRAKFYDPTQLTEAFVTIDRALDLVSLPYWPVRVHFNDLQIPALPLTVEAVRGFALNQEENPFLEYFRSRMSEIQAFRPDVIGISINGHAQLVPGLTLAALLKRPGGPHVTLGGNHLVRIKDGLLRSADFLETFADSVILGEGEAPLDRLLEVIEHSLDLSTVPGLVHLNRDRRAAYTFDVPARPLDGRSRPSLEGLPLQDYFSPELVLTTRTSKGCYWKKCTFCDTDFGVCPDNRSIQDLVDEVEHLQRNWGVKNFCFIDESLVPRYMERVVEAVGERGLEFHWYGNARLETSFTRERMQGMRRGGLTMLLWGLESGSDKVMQLINKGIKLHRRLDILKAASSAGVWNFCYIFFGFPGESWEDGMATIEMIESNTDCIHSYGRSVFTLNKHARLATDRLGIIDLVQDNEELSANLDYRLPNGQSKEQARRLAELCKLRCAAAYGDPLWMHLRYREVMHLYLKEHGRDFVAGYRFAPRALAALVGADNP